VDRSRLAILIPAYCEEATIGSVVRRASPYGDVVVADDCSRDRTVEMAEAAGATVLRNDTNRGYEGNLNRLFEYAGQQGYAFAVTLDADGEHHPETLEHFRRLLEVEGVPLVLGYRPRTQRVAEAVMGAYIRSRFGIRDILCGMKGYDMSLWRQAGVFDSSTSSIGCELALNAVRRGVPFAQIPVGGARRAGRPRFGPALSANIRIFSALLKATFGRSRAAKAAQGD
jgi:glycosyltransferase involved in cell wall biosynthesis